MDEATEKMVITRATIRIVGIAIASTDVKTIRVFIFRFLGIACIFSLFLSLFIVIQTR